MSRRVSSRIPRTRLYDSNYAIGESYYKDTLDRLDRKKAGRPASPPPREPSISKELRERHAEAFADEDIGSARRRAEKVIAEENLFDMPRMRPKSTALLEAENGFDEEIAKIQQRRKQLAVKMTDDVDMENLSNSITAQRIVSRAERMMDSVGLNENSARKLFDEDSQSQVMRRRVMKITSTTEGSENKNLTKWSALKDEEENTSGAAIRARRSKARLSDLEDEMEAMAEKQAARDRRVANLKALMAENAEESEVLQKRSARISARSEKKVVTF